MTKTQIEDGTINLWWMKLPEVGGWATHEANYIGYSLEDISALHKRIEAIKSDIAHHLQRAEERAKTHYTLDEIRRAKENAGWSDKQAAAAIAML